MKILQLLVIITMLTSCHSSESSSPKSILPEQLHGQWRNVYMKLRMNSYNNTDSVKTLEVNMENWESVMNIRPIRTFFWYNGTYNSQHFDLNDSLFYNPAGKWSLKGDTLTMIDTFPKPGIQYKYKLSINGNRAEFTGIEDLDGDGKSDDNYYGEQEKWTGKQVEFSTTIK